MLAVCFLLVCGSPPLRCHGAVANDLTWRLLVLGRVLLQVEESCELLMEDHDNELIQLLGELPDLVADAEEAAGATSAVTTEALEAKLELDVCAGLASKCDMKQLRDEL